MCNGGTSRPGLYIMVFLTLLNSCDASDNAHKLLKKMTDAVSVVQAQTR